MKSKRKPPLRCTPVWGECRRPSGHKGMHNAYSKAKTREPENDDDDTHDATERQKE